jgi:predicted O-linked N-acetylglucosamine transferase (SPINDLY family)
LNPQSAGDLANHGSYLKHSGEPLDAARWLRRALATRPGAADVHSALVYCLNYDAALDAAGLLAAAKLWNRRHARLAHPSTRLRGRRGVLRLGFVSGDFRRHPVGYFLSPFLRSLDRFRYQAVCYSNENFRDSVTDDIRSGATGWRQIHGQTDDAVEAQIHRDEIDVLVDLSGHTARNRLTLFTRRAAPVQLAWMGYFGTTGLTAIDAIVVDKIIAPPSSAIHYSEDLLHLPDCYICYAPPSAAPIAETTIDDDNRPATFGCFNDLGKISPLTLRMWSQIMAATPGSTLILKSAILDDENARRRWRLRLDAARIPVDRVSLEGWSPYDAYLRRYAAVDIALDPTPFSGGLTTLESLWMGVPAITLLGDRFAGRQSASYLTAIGRHELIARAPEEYIRLSVELAADASRRRNLRAHLRDDMLASVLCQPGRFTRQFEAALDRYMATNVGRKADADRPYRRK